VKTKREFQSSSCPTLGKSSSSSVESSRGAPLGSARGVLHRFIRLMTIATLLFSSVAVARGQYESHWNFNVGGGVGFPTGDLSNFINAGGNFVVGGGYNVYKHLGLDGEFMWHDLPVNSATKDALQTPGASARQYALTFDPIVQIPLGHKLGVYGIGGIGWYHRSGETTRPGTAIICDPYWSWWYGCTIGDVTVVTGSTSADAFGENIGGGVTYRLGESLKFYAEVRYHHASYHNVSTDILPLTFGLRF